MVISSQVSSTSVINFQNIVLGFLLHILSKNLDCLLSNLLNLSNLLFPLVSCISKLHQILLPLVLDLLLLLTQLLLPHTLNFLQVLSHLFLFLFNGLGSLFLGLLNLLLRLRLSLSSSTFLLLNILDHFLSQLVSLLTALTQLLICLSVLLGLLKFLLNLFKSDTRGSFRFRFQTFPQLLVVRASVSWDLNCK